MRFFICLSLLVFFVSPLSKVHAAEGTSIAGVVGGNDMRTAYPLPPGLYTAAIGAYSQAEDFYDGNGNFFPLLMDLDFDIKTGAFAFYYVPDFKIFDGTLGFLGTFSRSKECGRLSAFVPKRCTTGWGDPYVEINWSKFFGKIRPSQYEGAFPIAEGLAIQFGLGVVIPIGQYDMIDATNRGLSIGNNLWNIAPMAAFTYTTAPLLFEGTELSAKLYWNNYLENDDTKYKTGDIISLDFALTERIGSFQIGIAGTYVDQIEDDRQFGFDINRHVKGLSLGPVIGWDLPQQGITMKLKVQQSIIEENSSDVFSTVFSIATKLY